MSKIHRGLAVCKAGTGASQAAPWERIRLTAQEMQEMWVQSLGQEDPLEEGMATHSSIPALGKPMDRGA